MKNFFLGRLNTAAIQVLLKDERNHLTRLDTFWGFSRTLCRKIKTNRRRRKTDDNWVESDRIPEDFDNFRTSRPFLLKTNDLLVCTSIQINKKEGQGGRRGCRRDEVAEVEWRKNKLMMKEVEKRTKLLNTLKRKYKMAWNVSKVENKSSVTEKQYRCACWGVWFGSPAGTRRM